MSTAINDPATAVQALDAVESLLRVIVVRDLDIGVVLDGAGAARVQFDAPDWAAFLAAGVDEITAMPMHPMIRRRLALLLDEIRAIAPPQRQAELDLRIAELRSTSRVEGVS